ncbi:MarR family winged helix-turn-helix transcriptional regulator [Tolumonas osonensis]|uniref:DNA-binding MarR family transcriptional regulator n=1 Tax=Tolumonas osonensis TaxID=675874 RepID=A0A841GP31_9GAMM|nr:MarR family transcriptional regulator [Tolumonas osonensis]MBB6057055.1 DNA-binding MarR family transcriptional regulator [Tolumonas osonensis]
MNQKSLAVLSTLRRIIRTIDQNEKELSHLSGLTLPQLLILQTLRDEQPVTTGTLANRMDLAQATVTSILDRLENKGLVERQRNQLDKRKVWIQLTPEGISRLNAAPDTLQSRFITRFQNMKEWEQSMLIASLECIADLLEAPEVRTAPMLDSGELTRPGE